MPQGVGLDHVPDGLLVDTEVRVHWYVPHGGLLGAQIFKEWLEVHPAGEAPERTGAENEAYERLDSGWRRKSAAVGPQAS